MYIDIDKNLSLHGGTPPWNKTVKLWICEWYVLAVSEIVRTYVHKINNWRKMKSKLLKLDAPYNVIYAGGFVGRHVDDEVRYVV